MMRPAQEPGEAATPEHRYAPAPRTLADTELMLADAFTPLPGFLDRADVDAVRATGRLADGTPWPVPVTFDAAPATTLQAGVGDHVIVEDQEGAPIAQLEVRDQWAEGEVGRLAGPVRPLQSAVTGVFARFHRTPADVRAELAGRPAVAMLVDHPSHRDLLAALSRACESRDARPLLLVPTAGDRALPPESLVRLALAARDELPDAVVVAVRLAARDDPADDALLTGCVARAYGATALLGTAEVGDAAPIPVIAPEPMAYDEVAACWRPRTEVADGRTGLSDADVDELLAAGRPLPEWFTPRGVAAELRRARPPLPERGCAIFFTGLSGSGKSTIARALHDALAERADRTVTLLDGDVVRRMLSAGLGFSREDRDRNILRIGYVAAEVARHGGLAVCAPIAPYAATRDAVRAMVTAYGAGFVLVHVATPLEVCEQRDRKGLYAKARAGLIQEFTGISDPYETPVNAEVTIDTGELPIEESVRTIIGYLEAHGWLRASSELSVSDGAMAEPDTDNAGAITR
ncbi:MAG: adenylyl-sulfate kinase [Streptosporangiales bacterium]